MRITTGTSRSPINVHASCLNRNKYGSLPLSIDTTADALYTITTPVHTRSTVAVKSNLSDLSFRAILRCLKVGSSATDIPSVPTDQRINGPTTYHSVVDPLAVDRLARCEQSAVISRTWAETPPSQTGAGLRSQRTVLHRTARLMTAHCSRVTFHSDSSASTSCLNTRPRSA